MLFNSYGFIFVFLAIAIAGFFLIGMKSARCAALWLAGASLVFYGVWNPRYVLLLVISICFNYGVGREISHKLNKGSERQAELLLAGGIVINLAALAYFKYASFLATTLSHVTGLRLAISDIVLPLGISFFTFTQIAFLVDSSRKQVGDYSF